MPEAGKEPPNLAERGKHFRQDSGLCNGLQARKAKPTACLLRLNRTTISPMADEVALVKESDPIALPLSEDVIPGASEAPSTPVEEPGEAGVESPGAGEPVEPQAESSLFEDLDLDDLAKSDPKLKEFAQKMSDWGKARAQKSFDDRLEAAKTKAQKDAEAKSLEEQYNSAIEQTRQTLGGKAAATLNGLLKYVAENGMENINANSVVSQLVGDMFSATRTAVPLQLADDRAKALSVAYPGFQWSPEVTEEWTKALQSQDPMKLDQAYLKAIDEAARASVRAELDEKTAAEQAEAEKAAAKAKELKDVENTRNATARPTRDVPVTGGKTTTPEDLAKMGSNRLARLMREDPKRYEQMVREAEQVEERRAQRARSA